MKSPLIAAAAISLITAIALAGCAPLAQANNTGKLLGSRQFTRVGEVMLHVDIGENSQASENWPGRKADLPETAMNRGFSELGYVGLNAAMRPVFRRRDVDIVTSETPSRRKVVKPLPEVTAVFALDYSKGRLIAVRDHTIEIIEANPAGVTFTVQ